MERLKGLEGRESVMGSSGNIGRGARNLATNAYDQTGRETNLLRIKAPNYAAENPYQAAALEEGSPNEVSGKVTPEARQKVTQAPLTAQPTAKAPTAAKRRVDLFKTEGGVSGSVLQAGQVSGQKTLLGN